MTAQEANALRWVGPVIGCRRVPRLPARRSSHRLIFSLVHPILKTVGNVWA
jgi:hypothetical protein